MALSSQGTKKKVCYYYDGKNSIFTGEISSFYSQRNETRCLLWINSAQCLSSFECCLIVSRVQPHGAHASVSLACYLLFILLFLFTVSSKCTEWSLHQQISHFLYKCDILHTLFHVYSLSPANSVDKISFTLRAVRVHMK